MQQLFTQETPGKVMAFLGAALFSLAFLFSVSATNAGFNGSEYVLPNPFAPGVVVSAIDNVAASYSKALTAFAMPARQAVAIHMEGIGWIAGEVSEPISQALNLNSALEPQVAGAFIIDDDYIEPYSTMAAGSYESITIDDIYLALTGG